MLSSLTKLPHCWICGGTDLLLVKEGNLPDELYPEAMRIHGFLIPNLPEQKGDFAMSPKKQQVRATNILAGHQPSTYQRASRANSRVIRKMGISVRATNIYIKSNSFS
jgi:hypothetical protein